MKEIKLPESQMRSWSPRCPSAGLKRRIFEAPTRPMLVVAWPLRCLAPAATCLLLAIAVLNQGSTLPGSAGRHAFQSGMLGSNLIAYLPDNYQQEQNCCSPSTLEWTNPTGSTSSINSFRPAR